MYEKKLILTHDSFLDLCDRLARTMWRIAAAWAMVGTPHMQKGL